MERIEVKSPQQLPWEIRKNHITEKFSFLSQKDLLLIERNPSEFIERLQYITGMTRAEIISQIETI